MPRTIETTLYKFEELSEEAQAKAIENNCYSNIEGFDWWELYYDGIRERLQMIGIDIEITSFDIDRAASATFKGDYGYQKGWKQNPDIIDTDIIEIAQDLQNAQKKCLYKAEARMSEYGRNSVSVDVYNGQGYEELPQETIEAIEQALNGDLEAYIVKVLRRTYEYLTSDEAIKESLIANDCEFTIEGINA